MGRTACAAIGAAPLLSTVFNPARAYAQGSGEPRRTLVCIFLAGGCDSFNLLVPADTTPQNDGTYDEYETARSNLALSHPDKPPVIFNPDDDPADWIENPDFMFLNATGGSPYTDPYGRSYGIHPSCVRLKEMFEGFGGNPAEKRLAFIANIGTLIQPIPDVAAYKSGTIPLPKALFSHSDQQEQWHTSIPQGQTLLSGWFGRTADTMHSAYNFEQTNGFYMPMNYSLNGTTVLQTGVAEGQYVLTSDGALTFSGQSGSGNDIESVKNRALTELANDPGNQNYRNLFEQSYRQIISNSIERSEEFQDAFDAPGSINGHVVEDTINGAGFLDDELGRQLAAVIRTIAIRTVLKLYRQTIFVEYGGWDSHGELLNSQTALFNSLDANLYAYQSCLETLEIAEDVISFSGSDFGRTLRSNGRGTDHAWSGNQFVFGKSIDGGKLVGNYPSLLIDGPDDIGRGGRILPKVSTDEYFCELLDWFGITQSEMTSILPNIENFITLGPVNRPLGFIS